MPNWLEKSPRSLPKKALEGQRPRESYKSNPSLWMFKQGNDLAAGDALLVTHFQLSLKRKIQPSPAV